nr:hypothetical protein [Tanacetum cinerariifolium]
RYMDQRMNEAVKVAVQIQSDRLRDEAQAENEEFLKNLNENSQKIIKEQVKEKVKVQVSKILPKIEKTVNEQLEAEVLTRSSNSSNTSYAMAADLLEMELKKILIEKIESNKSIHRFDEQRNLYKALLSIHKEEETKYEESFDPIIQTPKNSDDEGNDDASLGLNVGSEKGQDAEDDEDELYRDVNINLEGRDVQMFKLHKNLKTLIPDAGIDSLFKITPQMNVSASTTVASLTLTAPTLPPPTIPTSSQVQQAPTPPTTAPSTFLQDLPNFGSAVSSIPGMIQRYMDQRMNEAVKRRHDDADKDEEPSAGSDRGSKRRREGKSIQRSDEQRNLYKALVEAYDADKTILDTYGESTILKRRREDDDYEGPSAGSDRRSKRQRGEGEHASASTPSEPATRSAGRSTTGSQSRQLSASESAFTEEPVQTTCQMEEPSHLPRRPPTPDRDWNKSVPAAQGEAQSWISALAKQTDARSSFNELLDTPIDFSNFIMNMLDIDTMTPELLAGPTYELMRG